MYSIYAVNDLLFGFIYNVFKGPTKLMLSIVHVKCIIVNIILLGQLKLIFVLEMVFSKPTHLT